MKKLFFFLLTLPLIFAACEENTQVDEPVVKEPVIKLSTEKMEFLCDGGEATISYTIENEVEGAELTATCEAKWITDLTIGEDITFNVAKNESRERETTIVVTYDTVSVEVEVKQYSDGGDHTTELTLNPADVLALSKDKQEAKIGYTLKSPVDGAELVARCDAEWISDIAVGESDIIFNVSANEGELRREATMAITYDTLAYEVKVVQYSATDNNTLELTMDWARRVPSSDYGLPSNYFLINFGDNNEILHFQLALVSNTGSDVLQAGTYTLLTEDLLLDGTQLYILTEGDQPYQFSNGRVSVALEENIYTFDIYLTGKDGRNYHITYTGEVERMGASSDDGKFVPYSVVAVSWWNPGNITLQLYLNMAYCHELDMYDLIGNSSDYLSEGVYTLAADGGDGKKQYISNSGSRFSLGNGQIEWLSEAEIEIKHNNKRTTTIKGYLKTESGNVAYIDWTGVVEGFDLTSYVAPEPDTDVELTASYLKGDYFPAGTNGNTLNNYNFTLADMPINRNYPAPGSMNFNIDLYSNVASADNTIPNGTYTFDATNSKASGTANGAKTLGFKVDTSGDKHSKDWKFVDGTVVVNDDNIEAIFTTDSGKTVTLHYNGSLALRPYSSDNNYDTVSRLYQDVEFNISNAVVYAKNNYNNYYSTTGADNWTVVIDENETKRGGIRLTLEFFADKSVGGWDGTYKAVAEKDLNKKDAYMNSFLMGAHNIAYNYNTGSWYEVIDGNGNPTYEVAPIVDGTITVQSNDNGTKTITLDCVDDAGFRITGTVITM